MNLCIRDRIVLYKVKPEEKTSSVDRSLNQQSLKNLHHVGSHFLYANVFSMRDQDKLFLIVRGVKNVRGKKNKKNMGEGKVEAEKGVGERAKEIPRVFFW